MAKRVWSASMNGGLMRKTLAMVLALAVSLGTAAVALGKKPPKSHSSSGHSTSGSHGGNSSTAPKVHVRGNTRKDGTYVAPHERSHSGAGSHTDTHHIPAAPHLRLPKNDGATPKASTPHLGTKTRSTPHDDSVTPQVTSPKSITGVARDEHGRFKRSEAVKDQFKRQHPCPATGKSSGPCPGYVIDHVVPLCASGPDAAYNMQWQTLEQSKEKDHWERKECKVFPKR
jgi:hypothetical protein